MCEVLAGSLAGTGASDDKRVHWANGMLSIYVDPARLDASAFFPEDVVRYVDYVKSAQPIEAEGEVLVPGEPERRMRRVRLATGIALAAETWGAIRATAAGLGVKTSSVC
jgi:uncharacterized oxidoreductase